MSFGDFNDALDSSYDCNPPSEEEMYNWQQHKNNVEIFAKLFYKWQNLPIEIQKPCYELIQILNTSDDEDAIEMSLNTLVDALYYEE